jgi:hypothetical protein
MPQIKINSVEHTIEPILKMPGTDEEESVKAIHALPWSARSR